MHDDDVELDFEAESAESGTLEQAAKRIKKLRAELEQCKKERQEYLDGWQRMRADVANQKKADAHAHDRLRSIVKEEVLNDLLPALDAFDMAMQSAGWSAVDAAWRSGVEYIYTQLIGALEKNGVTTFGSVGDVYSPHLHEAVAQSGEPDEIQRITEVRRKGYCMGEIVLRPAQVLVNPAKS